MKKTVQMIRRRLAASLAALLVCCGLLLQPAAAASEAFASEVISSHTGDLSPAGGEVSVPGGDAGVPDPGSGADAEETLPEDLQSPADAPETGSPAAGAKPEKTPSAGEESLLPGESAALSASPADSQPQPDDGVPFSDAARAGELALDEANFPDPAFRAALAAYDTDASGGLSDAERGAVTTLGLSGLQITDLTGIALFEDLTVLNVQLNRLGRLDLSSNTKLSVLYASNNALTEVLLPVSLRTADLAGNRLETLSLSGMRELTLLLADDNRLTSLDLSDCPLSEGYGFSANGNYLTRVTLPQNGASYDWGDYLADQLLPPGKTRGYRMVWSDDSGPIDPADGALTCSGQTLTAEVLPIRYRVSFSAGQAETSGVTDPVDAVYDTAFALPDCGFLPADDEIVFAGWKIGGSVYSAGTQLSNLTDQDGAQLTAVAQWKEKDFSGQTYTVTLHSGSDSEQLTGYYGQALTLTTGLSREHYHLVGWALSEGGAVQYAANGSLLFLRPSEISAARDGQLSLWAVWEIDRHLVSFSGPGISLPNLRVDYGSTITLPEAPARTGYLFEGWYDGNGALWDAALDRVEKDITLTARYRPIRYTLRFDTGGAEGSLSDLENLAYTDLFRLPHADLTLAWHDFAGWALTPGGSVVYHDEAQVSALSAVDGGTVTLYAVWQRQQAEVTAVIGGSEQIFGTGMGLPLSIPAPVRTGWRFTGWLDENGDPWPDDQIVTGPLKLTASFVPISYTVSFDGAGAANADAMQALSLSLQYDERAQLPQNCFSRPGWQFAGWALTPGGSVKYTDGAPVSALTASDGRTVVLYAVWQPEPAAPGTGSTDSGAAGTDDPAGSAGGVLVPVTGHTPSRPDTGSTGSGSSAQNPDTDGAAAPDSSSAPGTAQQEQQPAVGSADSDAGSALPAVAAAAAAAVVAGGAVLVIRRRRG